MGVAAVVLAGGSGTRVGAAVNKVYLPLAGRSVISRSLATFAEVPGIDVLVLVVRPADRERAEAILAGEVDRPGVELVHGGASRQESELRALRHLAARIEAAAVDVVLIHDGARPLVSPALAAEVIAAARAHGGAVPGLHRRDLARVTPDGRHLAGRAEAGLFAVQTPQGFRAGPLLAAYEEAAREGFTGTDTASCVERFADLRVRAVPGEPSNIKITYPHDLVIAERVLAGQSAGADPDAG